MAKTYIINSVETFDTYAEYTLDNVDVVSGKYGDFVHALQVCVNQFNEEPKPPYKVKFDSQFKVTKILCNGVFVGPKVVNYG